MIYIHLLFYVYLGEKAMSFDRFVAVAMKCQIFSQQKQKIFQDAFSQQVNKIHKFLIK